MKNRVYLKVFVCFLSVSFLLLVNGFPEMIAEAKEFGLPIGEMVSNGEVKVEVRDKVWKEVDPSHSPIFKGAKIRTEKGTAALSLTNQSQIEMDPHSLLSVDMSDRFFLSQGQVKFRISTSADMDIRVGNLIITKFKPLQVAKDLTLVSPKQEETIGSLVLHPNGSVTLKSAQGPLSILNQDRVVLAALSSRESVTIPSISVKGTTPRMMVAQAGETTPGASAGAESGEFLGLGTWTWIGIAGGVAAIGGIAAAAGDGGGSSRGAAPVCP
jgi:hypothetical protein